MGYHFEYPQPHTLQIDLGLCWRFFTFRFQYVTANNIIWLRWSINRSWWRSIILSRDSKHEWISKRKQQTRVGMSLWAHTEGTLSIYSGLAYGCKHTLIARFVGPRWDPSGTDRTQVGPMLAPWTLLSGYDLEIPYSTIIKTCLVFKVCNVSFGGCHQTTVQHNYH